MHSFRMPRSASASGMLCAFEGFFNFCIFLLFESHLIFFNRSDTHTPQGHAEGRTALCSTGVSVFPSTWTSGASLKALSTLAV